MSFPHLAQRLFNVPLIIHPPKAEVVMAALADRLGIAHMFSGGVEVALKPTAFADDLDDNAPLYNSEGYLLVQGVAIVPVAGTLVQKLGSLRPYSGMTGYNAIRHNFLTAMTNPSVKAVMLDIDSPGGEVAGCFDLVDTIYEWRGEKPIWAVLNESAYSAAYAIASAADRITVPRTGGTGSIGVIAMHVDWSQALSKAGITVTLLQYGARKADGHPEIPLSDEARERFMADIETMGELFVNTVARNRKISADTVRKTEAATYLGAEGVTLGLADAVMAPDVAFRALLDELA